LKFLFKLISKIIYYLTFRICYYKTAQAAARGQTKISKQQARGSQQKATGKGRLQ
jgi:hypothetical protein